MIYQNTYTTDELLMEEIWEGEYIRRGVDRYYQTLEGQDLENTTAGQSLLKRIVPALCEALEAHRDQMMAEMAEAGGVKRSASSLLLADVNPEYLAVGASQSLLTMLFTHRECDLSGMLSSLSRGYVSARSLELFEQEDPEGYSSFFNHNSEALGAMSGKAGAQKRRRLHKKLAKVWAEYYPEGGNESGNSNSELGVSCDLLDLIGYTRVKVISAEALRESDDWVLVDGVPCVVLDQVGLFPELFIVKDHLINSHTHRHIMFSDQAEALIDRTIERGETGAWLNPAMLIKPKRWILATAK